MALILNEEQELLRDSARDFLAERSPVAEFRNLRDSGEEWSPELWLQMAEMGWTGIVIPEEYGGLDFGHIGAGLLAEECGRTLTASPFVSTALVGAGLIAALGSEHQKTSLLPSIVAGDRIVTLAWAERGSDDPADIAVAAAQSGGSYQLDGEKVSVLHGAYANTFIVAARTSAVPGDQDGLSMFLLDRDTEGVEISTTLNADNRRVAKVRFSAVKVPFDALLGEEGNAWTALQRALDVGAVGTSAELLGIAEESFERTIEYLRERKQFGVPVGSFQALQHRAALLFCELHLCRSLVLQALTAISRDSEGLAVLSSSTKAKCGQTARLAVNEAVQMHAGIGMTDEFDIGFFMKRAAAARQEYGDEYFHTDRFARLRGY